MITQVAEERVMALNDATVRTGDYVLYWMQSSQRTEENPALVYAVEQADRLNLPLVVYFGLFPSYPESNLRHFRFMLEGLHEISGSLETLGIQFVLMTEPPDRGIIRLAEDAALVVADRGYLKMHRAWYGTVASLCRCPVMQIEGNVVVPVETASQKEEYAAGTFRPKVTRQLDRFLLPTETDGPKRSSTGLHFPTLAGEPPDTILSQIIIDRTVPASEISRGGNTEAHRRFGQFLKTRIDRFAEERNDPGGDGGSCMSPYLHFGQVSPVTLALQAQEQGGNGVQAFFEELIVRRELAVNFVRYNNAYDSFASLPAWAQKTLAEHRGDPREYVYSQNELEGARTHDPYWNAAQQEMVKTGTMQGYMRMYWGKKILEWSPSPQEAYRIALYLNNRYEIDGRDPNGYAGVAWCFGKHDRPWKERKIFGMVRYMNAAGLERKFAMDAYLDKIRTVSRDANDSREGGSGRS